MGGAHWYIGSKELCSKKQKPTQTMFPLCQAQRSLLEAPPTSKQVLAEDFGGKVLASGKLENEQILVKCLRVSSLPCKRAATQPRACLLSQNFSVS